MDRRIVKGFARKRAGECHPLRDSVGHEHIVWEAGHPTTGSFSFREAGPRLATKALRCLDPLPSAVMLKQLGGGFSGAYVVKAQPSDRGKTFVLKIDEEPKKLKRELEGYRTITSYVSHDYYLPIVDASSPVTLAAEWWATFLMPYEGNAKPLIEHIDVGGPELAELYRSIWEKCLFDLYGTVTSKDVSSEVIDGAEALRLAKSGLHGLHRYLSIAKRFLALIWAGQLVDAKW